MRRSLLLLALALTTAACGSQFQQPQQESPSQRRSQFFGVNGASLFNLPRAVWGRHLNAIAAAEMGVVRVGANWEAVEKAPPRRGRHFYDWRHMDAIASALARRRLRWLPVIGFSAPWAGSIPGERFSPPARPAEFARYARAFALRYGRDGSFWRRHPSLPEVPVTALEIWNEPDLEFFWRPRPNPAAYADLYLTARRAVRGAVPRMETLLGGLSSDRGVAFLTAMYRARPGLRGQAEAVSFHPYAGDPEGVMARIVSMRRALDLLGESELPIDVTEFGWALHGSDGPIQDDGVRARFLAQVADRVARSDCGVRKLLPYEWTSRMINLANIEDWFGLYRPNGSATGSGASYAQTVRRLERANTPSQPATLRVCPLQ